MTDTDAGDRPTPGPAAGGEAPEGAASPEGGAASSGGGSSNARRRGSRGGRNRSRPRPEGEEGADRASTADGDAADQGAAILAHPVASIRFPRERRVIVPQSELICAGPALARALERLRKVARDAAD